MLPLVLPPEAFCVHPSKTCIFLYTGTLLEAFLLTVTTLFPRQFFVPINDWCSQPIML